MKKGVVAGVAVAALVGIGAVAIPLVQGYAAAHVKAEIERNGTATVERVEVGILDRSIALEGLKSDRAGPVSIGLWRVSGLGWPLAELLQGRTPLSGFQWGDPLQADRLELQDVRIGNGGGGGGIEVGSLVLHGIELARYDSRDTQPDRGLALVAQAMAALSVRRLEQRNSVLTMPGSGDTLGVAAVVVERYERGRIATVVSGGVEATEKDGRAPLFKVTDIEASDLDFRRALAALSLDGWMTSGWLGKIRVARASGSGFGGETLARYGLSLGTVSIESVRGNDEVSRSRARVDGFVLAPPVRGMESLRLRMALQAMGLKELRLAFDCAGTEDRGRNEITIDHCALSGTDLAEISVAGRIVDADDALWHAIDDGDLAVLHDSKVGLASARLVIADKSLLERGLKAFATLTFQPAAAVRTNLALDIRKYQPAGVLITPNMTQVLDTVARFVEQGGTLTLDARPDPPLGLDRLDYLSRPGADLVDALALSATLAR